MYAPQQTSPRVRLQQVHRCRAILFPTESTVTGQSRCHYSHSPCFEQPCLPCRRSGRSDCSPPQHTHLPRHPRTHKHVTVCRIGTSALRPCCRHPHCYQHIQYSLVFMMETIATASVEAIMAPNMHAWIHSHPYLPAQGSQQARAAGSRGWVQQRLHVQ